jgi:hypothetical protein
MSRKLISARPWLTIVIGALLLLVVASTEAAAQAPPTADQGYYWCQLLMPVHGNSVLYVSRVLPNPKPIAKGVAQEEIGRAFVRYLVKKYPPDDPNQFADSPHWGSVCKTTWPYGLSSAKTPRDTAIAAGAVAVDWQYTPDQDVPLPSASQPGPAPLTASEAAINAHCQHIANEYALAKCRERWGGQPTPAAAAPAAPAHPAIAPAPAAHPAVATTLVAASHQPAAPAPAPHPPAAQKQSVAVTTPPPAAPKPPKKVYVVCSGDSSPHTKYLNPPIDGGSGDNATWTQGYRAYLEPRYGYRGNIRCNRQPTLDAAQTFYEKKLEQLRNKPGNGGALPKIVVTDWKK